MSTEKAAYPNEVTQVDIPIPDSGLRVDHPRLREAAFNCYKLGWGNEEVARVTGLPGSFVAKYRHEYEKERKEQEAHKK